MGDEIGEGVTGGEVDLLIDGLSDDIDFTWALIGLGLRRNDGTDPTPTPALVDEAFGHLGRLLELDLIRIGRMEYVDPNQPKGTLAPVKHVSEPIGAVRRRVLDALAADAMGDWPYECWIVNTEAGDILARQVLERAEHRKSVAFRRWLEARNFLRKLNYATLHTLTRAVDDLDDEVSSVVIRLQRRDDDREIQWPVNDLLADLDRLMNWLSGYVPATDDEVRSLAALVEWVTEMRKVYVEALARRSH